MPEVMNGRAQGNIGEEFGVIFGKALCGCCNSERQVGKPLAESIYVYPCDRCGSRGVILEVASMTPKLSLA